jgi:hypothetical protein
MPILKPLLCAATLALAMPMAALAQPAPSNEPPAANAPNMERRDDGPRWRDREYRRERNSDDERGERRRWREGRDGGDDDRQSRRLERFHEGMRQRERVERDRAERGVMRPFGMARMCGPDGARVGDAMIERLERATQPTAEQRPAFDKLKEAAAKAGEQMRAGCVTERPVTPTGRLAAAEKRLSAMLDGIRTLRPAMDAYYGSLTDEQKARLTLAQRGHGERWHHRRGHDRDRRGGSGPINL